MDYAKCTYPDQLSKGIQLLLKYPLKCTQSNKIKMLEVLCQSVYYNPWYFKIPGNRHSPLFKIPVSCLFAYVNKLPNILNTIELLLLGKVLGKSLYFEQRGVATPPRYLTTPESCFCCVDIAAQAVIVAYADLTA